MDRDPSTRHDGQGESDATRGAATAAWSLVADAWDRRGEEIEELTQPATSAMIDRLAIREGERVLEIAAGPGYLGAMFARLVGTGGSVLISDLSPAMVRAASMRNAGTATIDTAVLDIMAIDRPTASADVVACRMGLMFAPDPVVALGEVGRVLAPGGRLGAMTWAGPEHNPWLTCVGMAAMANGVVDGGPPTGPGGIFSLGDQDRLTGLVDAAGFDDAVVEHHDVTFAAVDIDEHIDRVLALAGPLAAAMSAAPSDRQEDVRRMAAELAAPYLRDGGVELPGRALVVTATRR